MTNKIELFKAYIPLIDEVYKTASLTSILDGPAELIQETQQAGEFLIPKMDMDGLADYSRGDGYAQGSVSLTYETKKANYDRARKFSVNAMDNVETAGIAFGKLSSEFMRTKAVPELDAFRFASYAKAAKTVKTGALADGKAWLEAVSEANVALSNAEVSTENRILYISPAGLEAINNLDTIASRAALARFAQIIETPQPRFASAIKLLSGKESESAGGFKKDDAGKDINFLIVQKDAVIQFTKNVVSKVITPEENQNDDAWLFFFHLYGIAENYDNKKDGIYVHTVA